MKPMKAFILALCFSAMSGMASGQGYPIEGDFRSRQSGNWDDPNTWERFTEATSQWVWPANSIPSHNDRRVQISIYITGGEIDTVRVTSSASPVTIDELTVQGVLEIHPGGDVTVVRNPNAKEDEYDIRGIGKVIVICGGTFTPIGKGDWETLELIPCASGKARASEKALSSLSAPVLNNFGEIRVRSLLLGDGVINNHGDLVINGKFTWENGSVTGNPFRYGMDGKGGGTLILNRPTVIDSIGIGKFFWPDTNGPSAVSVQAPLTMNVPRTLFSGSRINAPVTNAYNLSFIDPTSTGLYPFVELGTGGSFDSAPFYDEGATLVYMGDGTRNVGYEWTSGTAVGRGVPSNVRIGGGHLHGHNLTLNMPSGPRRCPAKLQNYGTLVLSPSAGANLSVGGEFSSTGKLIPNSQEVTLDGTTLQAVFNQTPFDRLTINNPAGIYWQLAGKVNQTLTFLAGNLWIELPLVLSGDVIGASSTRHVVPINGYAGVTRTMAGGESFQFPLGPTANRYNPLTIALDPADPTETFTVRVDSTFFTFASENAYFVQRAWYIQETTPGGNHAALTFQWTGAEEGAKFSRNASSTYLRQQPEVEVAQNGVASGTDPYIVSTTVGFPATEFSGDHAPYIVGTSVRFPLANAGSDMVMCGNGSEIIGGNPTGSGGFGGPCTFSWTPATGLNDPTVPNPVASPATTTTYTVTVTETATGLSATDEVTVTVTPAWAVAHIVDADEIVKGIDQGATDGTALRDNRGLALSPDARYVYLGYNLRSSRRIVRKIDLDLSLDDPARNHRAVVAQLQLPQGAQPARGIATDDQGRVYLALGTKILVYNANLQTPALHDISGFTACEGVAVRRENGMLAVYATDRLDKTLERFVLVEGVGDEIVSSSKAGLDGDGEVRIMGAKSPRGLDVASDGTAWIADLGRGKVFRVNSDGLTADSTGVAKAMDIAIDETRNEVFVSQYTQRTLKVLNLSNGRSKRALIPPAAELNIDLDGETGTGALSGLAVAPRPPELNMAREGETSASVLGGIDITLCTPVYVANERGRSILTGNPPDSPFSNIGDDNDVKAADTDPVLVLTGKGIPTIGETEEAEVENAKVEESEVEESEVEESEVANDQLTVTSYQLDQNYPNPFNPSTKISFALPKATEVSLKIYDLAGHLVQTLVEGVVEAGRHQVAWNGTNQHGVPVASGIYFYQLRAGEFTQVRKMSFMK